MLSSRITKRAVEEEAVVAADAAVAASEEVAAVAVVHVAELVNDKTEVADDKTTTVSLLVEVENFWSKTFILEYPTATFKNCFHNSELYASLQFITTTLDDQWELLIYTSIEKAMLKRQ